ncbi:hypothetical protein ABT168_02495 [Streptomyces sp. NPDC001793]|uniref:hypothetical protein n=1 Tax=Streptomyces sp. NPDC001793 TaxID=3154657 RepID=UPI003322A0B1
MSKPRPRIVVHPPAPTGGRRVYVDAESLGVAFDVADLREFLRLAGRDPEGVWLDDPASIGHTLKDASLQCTLFIECTDDVPYDCTLTAPDDVTYDRWARHLLDVLNHYCE